MLKLELSYLSDLLILAKNVCPGPTFRHHTIGFYFSQGSSITDCNMVNIVMPAPQRGRYALPSICPPVFQSASLYVSRVRMVAKSSSPHNGRHKNFYSQIVQKKCQKSATEKCQNTTNYVVQNTDTVLQQLNFSSQKTGS